MPKSVTAAEVRSFYRADEKRLARLSDEARANVREGVRGRLHPEVIADHNKRRRTVTYTTGAGVAASRARSEARAALVAQGLAGARGPLSKAAKASLATSKG